MILFKTLIRVIILLSLCIPIIYLQYYIIKDTAKSMMIDMNQKQGISNNKRKDYLRVAK